ncbi:MAG: GNAT family N-acetyltransferase [Clostridia bacterium]
MQCILQSKRLVFRKITENDFDALKVILQNEMTMYAWEHAFSDEEIKQWITKNIERYHCDGFSYFLVSTKESKEIIGVAGPLIERIGDDKFVGIAYIIDNKYWGRGFGFESAKASLDYAFEILKAEKVVAEIRPNNTSSRKIADKLNMKIQFQFDKIYNGKILPHLVYSINKNAKNY